MIIKSTIVLVKGPGAAVLVEPRLAVALSGSGKPEAATRELREAFRLGPGVQAGQPTSRELPR
jgi:hypothetical protein